MDAIQVIFLIGAFITLASSVMVVADRKLFHSAVWLIVALFGVAILFVLLDAGFLAAAQVVVYIGAIAILIIFAVMLTRRVMQETPEAQNSEWPLAAAGALLLFAIITVPVGQIGLVHRVARWSTMSAQPVASTTDSLVTLGRVLVDATTPGGAYAVPFELASLLLLGAMVGAIVIARDKK